MLIGFVLFEPIARAIVEGRPTAGSQGLIAGPTVRLVPVYYIAVLAVWFGRQQSLPGDWRDLLEHLTFTEVFDEKRIFYTDGPAWAISVIMLFCIGLSALSVGLSWTGQRVHSTRGRLKLIAGAAAAPAVVPIAWKTCAFALWHRSTSGSFTTWFGPIASLDNFATGMAVAVLIVALGTVATWTRGSG